MLKIEVAHFGKCREPCEGMNNMGMFQAFGAPATNYGRNKIIFCVFRIITIALILGASHVLPSILTLFLVGGVFQYLEGAVHTKVTRKVEM